MEKRLRLFLVLCMAGACINTKNDKSWDDLSVSEQQEYINVKQQLGSYVASCGGNVTEALIWEFLKKIGTPIALNLMYNCKKVDIFIKQAEQLAVTGKYKESILKIDDAILVDRTNFVVWYMRGEIHFASGNYLQSISDYTIAINLIAPIKPYTGTLYVKRALAYQNIGNMFAMKSDCLLAASFDNAEAKQILIVNGWL